MNYAKKILHQELNDLLATKDMLLRSHLDFTPDNSFSNINMKEVPGSEKLEISIFQVKHALRQISFNYDEKTKNLVLKLYKGGLHPNAISSRVDVSKQKIWNIIKAAS